MVISIMVGKKNIFAHVKRPFVWFRNTRRRNKIFAVLGVVIVLLIVLGQIQSAFAPSPYKLASAKKTTIVEKVSETGNVSVAGRVDVHSTATGVIEEIYVDNGSHVETGQNLFHVRSTATQQEKASAYASYQTAVSNLKSAEQAKPTYDAQMWGAQQALLDARNVQNYKNNNKKNPATGEDYTDLEKESIDTNAVTAEKSFRALEKKTLEADTSIQAAKAQVASTLIAYQATSDVIITAPTSGTVTNLSSSVGDTVTVNSGMTAVSLTTPTQSPVLTIANLGDYSIKVAINEVDIPKVKNGQRAVITLDAFRDKEFTGNVTHVDSVGTNDQGVITYSVLVVIKDPHPSIKPGMTANVDIEVDKKENVLSVPNSAVKPYQGGRAVRVVNPQTKEIEYIKVITGLKGENQTEIVKGLSENQEVIVSLSNDQLKRPGLF